MVSVPVCLFLLIGLAVQPKLFATINVGEMAFTVRVMLAAVIATFAKV